MMVKWFIGFDVAMGIICAFAAFAVSYYAGKAFRLTSERLLLFLNLSFALLGVGLLTDSLTTLYVYGQILLGGSAPGRTLLLVGNTIFSVSEIAAFSLLAYLYARQTAALGTLAAAPIRYLSKTYNPVAETVLIFLLGYITLQALTNYGVKREADSLLVFSGFCFILIGHCCLLLIFLSPFLYVAAYLSQLVGFLCFLAMLLRLGRRGP